MMPDEPIAFAEPKLKTPALMFAPPAKVLLPLKVSVPTPVLIIFPSPEIVFDTVSALVLLKVIL